MNFAFLVHPLSEETNHLVEIDPHGALREKFGQDIFSFCGELHRAVSAARCRRTTGQPKRVRVVDELVGLLSERGATVDGRLYEIPMGAMAILDDAARAIDYMQQAVEEATEWGAKIVGLGSMTGIVGGQGAYLAEHAAVPVTTGNSLTVFAALENLDHVCQEVEIDLSEETVAVIGIPGSISTAAAKLLARRCKSLVLVGRHRSGRATRLAEELDAELLLDIPQALRQARVVFSATSSGSCIAQRRLQPGSIVVDAAVPTDVQGIKAERSDVLLLTGGLSKVPPSMPLHSHYLWFHHGMIPSCLAETIVLALENRTECFSLGRNLQPERIEEIGEIARSHGFSFSELFSFGIPLDDSALVGFRKLMARQYVGAGNGQPVSLDASDRKAVAPPSAEQLAPRAARLHARHINPVLIGLGGTSGFVKTFVKGEGTELCDAAGNRYLDFVAGFGSLNLGHNHPAVVEAVNRAMLHGAPGFAQSAINPFAAALAEQLAVISPPGLTMTFFGNSGSEAVEAALKLARRVTGRPQLVYCDRSYHGKTLGSLSITGNPDYQRPFGPLLPQCRHVPYGDLECLERVLSEREAAAFVVEPIQAEGGMVVPPADYLREAQHLCRKTGTLLVVDEVQTGMGRTGAMFAVDHLDIEPDVITLAKSLGGGLIPIGAMLTRRDLWLKAYGNVQTFALHTSTFGGGSLACAAGLATLDVLRDEQLAENATARGRQLLDGLNELHAHSNSIHDVRGQGLLIGVELQPLPGSLISHLKEVDQNRIAAHLVPEFDRAVASIAPVFIMTNMLEEHGIYMQAARSNPFVLRVQPPLTVTAAEVKRFLGALEECCAELDFAVDMFDGIIAKSGLGQHEASQRNAPANDAKPPAV